MIIRLHMFRNIFHTYSTYLAIVPSVLRVGYNFTEMAHRLSTRKPNIIPSPVASQLRSSPHFTFRFEPFAKPINCTTLPITNTILADYAHPLYIPIKRRIDNSSSDRLHWAVRCPAALCRKRTVRMWVSKRIREAFLAELKHNGFDRNGALLKHPSYQYIGDHSKPSQLTGALVLHVRESSVTAPISDIRQHCTYLVNKLVRDHVNSALKFEGKRSVVKPKRQVSARIGSSS